MNRILNLWLIRNIHKYLTLNQKHTRQQLIYYIEWIFEGFTKRVFIKIIKNKQGKKSDAL